MTEVELKGVTKFRNKSGVDNPSFDTDGSSYEEEKNAHFHQGVANGMAAEDGIEDIDGDHVDKTKADDDLNACSRGINNIQRVVIKFLVTYQKIITYLILVLILLLYLAYFAYSLHWRFGDEGSIRLLVCTIIGVILLILHFAGDWLGRTIRKGGPSISHSTSIRIKTVIRWLLYVVSLVGMVTLLIILVAMKTPDNLISLAGLAAFIVLAWVTSINPARVNWHTVFWGFSLQFYFAVIILKTRWGYEAFKWLGDRVSEFLAYSDEGAAFVFGENFREHLFAFSVLPVIIFFSSVITVLYYLGVMQAIISVIGRFLSFCMHTTPAESINAAGNIFVGMTEAPLMIQPYIGKMTKSELHAVMTGGFATIAGSVLGAYIGFGIPANHLLAASVMSAPAALAISKLTYPETETPMIDDDEYTKMEKGSERNLIEAASSGASSAISLVANVAVNVMAFLSILKFVNVTLTWFGERAGVQRVTFQFICSYVLYPVALFMGTELGLDCRRVAELVGIKTFTNEFIAYSSLEVLIKNRKTWLNYTSIYDVNNSSNVIYDDLDVNLTRWNIVLEKGFLSPRSEVIATYALCGFSNFGSMGILLGGLSGIAPHRKHDMAAIVFRAMIAGNVACFFTACVAGLFFEEFA